MRPKTREMTQHRGSPGWLERDPAGWGLFCDGRSMPLSLTDRTACPGLELLSCELLANPAAVADVLVLIAHKTLSWALSRKEGMGQNQSCESRRQTISSISRPRFREIWKVSSLSRSLPLLGKKVSPRSRPLFGFSRPNPAENESSIANR